jgi:tRNA-uridine 2-sulfurtransferase
MGGQSGKILKVKGISLLSGGLDSILAAKVILEQDIDVLGVTFETPFFNAKKAKRSAEEIGLPLLVSNITDEHLTMLRAPRYGYGKNMNPCIDCHTLMLNKAGRIMEEYGADFVFTGEVLGQRPMSQNRQSLHTVAKNSGYGEYIVRPLSAKRLPETKPELEGKINRERLLDITGRGRKRQLELASYYDIKEYGSPAGGCLLTDPLFSRRLKELFQQPSFTIRDIELLRLGRHFRLEPSCKVIVGRNSFENEAMLRLSNIDDVIIHVSQYPGPTVLVTGGCSDTLLPTAASICVLYSDAPKDKDIITICKTGTQTNQLSAEAAVKQAVEQWVI